MARMNVVFKDTLLEEMRELVPVRQRSEFIEEAVRARLAQLRQIKAVEAAAGAWSSEGRVEPSQEIREVRSALGRPAAPWRTGSWLISSWTPTW